MNSAVFAITSVEQAIGWLKSFGIVLQGAFSCCLMHCLLCIVKNMGMHIVPHHPVEHSSLEDSIKSIIATFAVHFTAWHTLKETLSVNLFVFMFQI